MSEPSYRPNYGNLPLALSAPKQPLPISRSKRQQVAETKKTIDDVRQAKVKVDGHIALGAYVMRRAKDLDEERQSLAGFDEGLNQILAQIEMNTLNAIFKVQRDMYGNGFGF
jgi:hypothetical protein